MQMSSFLVSRHRTLPGYVPGTHSEEADVIRLNTNESPYPPSKEVLEAIQEEAARLNYYNDPDCNDLRTALGSRHAVSPEWIMAGNGSDQILQLAFLAFADEQCPIYLPDVTYSYYDLFAALYHIPLVRISLSEDYSLEPQRYANVPGMIVFPNPNAPTGLAVSREAIRKLAENSPEHVILVDEAYVDFGGETSIPLTREFPNLLVVRTFSKSGSLAGLRLGYCVGNPALIEELGRIRNAMDLYGVNRLAQAAGIAACRNWTYYEKNAERIMASRAYTTEKLRELGFTVLESKGNFVFARPGNCEAETLRKQLMERGLLVRHFAGERTEQYLRITIGTQQEMEHLVAALKDILKA